MAKPALVANLAEQIDELGRLEAQLAPLKPAIARAEHLRRLMADSFDGAANETGVLVGNEYFSQVGARSWKRRITSMRKACKAIGERIFFQNCSITLDKFEGLCPAAEQPGLVVNEQVGPRKVDTFHRLAA
jgi:hypothetical protein